MQSKVIAYIFTIIAVIFWGTSFIATKIAYHAFTPLTLCFVRFSIAAVIMTLIRVIRHDHQIIHKKDIPYMILIALVGISIYYSCENTAVSMTSAATASLISGSYPAITLLVGVLFYQMKLNRRKVIGVALAVAGVVILTDFSSGMSGSNELLGDLIMIFDGFLWGFYNFLIPKANPEYSTFTLTYYQTLFGVIFLIPGVLYEHPAMVTLSPSVVMAVLYLSLGCSVGAYLMYNHALKKISPSTAAVIMNLMPIAGFVFSALILNEAITLRHIVGGVIIITGVIISSKE